MYASCITQKKRNKGLKVSTTYIKLAHNSVIIYCCLCYVNNEHEVSFDVKKSGGEQSSPLT